MRRRRFDKEAYAKELEAQWQAKVAAIYAEHLVVPQVESKILRPKTWDEFIGQESTRKRLRLHAEAALGANRRMDHVLLIGPPGSGKTTLAEVIASSMHAQFASYVWPVDQITLERIVSNFTGVVLLDEIHRGTPSRQETLLPLIEDDYLQLKSGARIYAEGRLTIVGATTEPDKIIAPLFDRFSIKPTFDPYTDDEMAQIVTRMARILGASVDHQMAIELGRATGGTPRYAESFVETLRDMQQTGMDATAADVLALCRVSPDGLTADHHAYLNCLKIMGGTAGLRIIATHIRKPEGYVRELERLLLAKGKIRYGERGRVLQ